MSTSLWAEREEKTRTRGTEISGDPGCCGGVGRLLMTQKKPSIEGVAPQVNPFGRTVVTTGGNGVGKEKVTSTKVLEKASSDKDKAKYTRALTGVTSDSRLSKCLVESLRTTRRRGREKEATLTGSIRITPPSLGLFSGETLKIGAVRERLLGVRHVDSVTGTSLRGLRCSEGKSEGGVRGGIAGVV